jgi:hypothetical protein
MAMAVPRHVISQRLRPERGGAEASRRMEAAGGREMCRRMAVPMAVVLRCGASMGNRTAPEVETESGDGMTAAARRVAVG